MVTVCILYLIHLIILSKHFTMHVYITHIITVYILHLTSHLILQSSVHLGQVASEDYQCIIIDHLFLAWFLKKHMFIHSWQMSAVRNLKLLSVYHCLVVNHERSFPVWLPTVRCCSDITCNGQVRWLCHSTAKPGLDMFDFSIWFFLNYILTRIKKLKCFYFHIRYILR